MVNCATLNHTIPPYELGQSYPLPPDYKSVGGDVLDFQKPDEPEFIGV